jgi:hypothetical protein
MLIQTDEFFQLDLYQLNFEGSNGTWGGLFSGGRYGWEQPTEYQPEDSPYDQALYPVELITEVGPTPPRYYGGHSENVPDGGLTSLMLVVAVASLVLARRFG